MIFFKSQQEISLMKEGGLLSRRVLDQVVESIKPGITTLELDKLADELILKYGGKPSFKMVDGYKFATCININEGVVHGIPNDYVIKPGDLVSVDLGVYHKGFHTDVSHTVEVETQTEHRFLEVGEEALERAIEACKEGNYIGDISNAMQSVVERAGFSVSRDLVGHGVGRELHEDPYVPCFGKKGSGPVLKEGMVLAIEVIYQKGKPDLVLEADGWTLSTKDGSLSGLFEKTIAVSRQETLVLT